MGMHGFGQVSSPEVVVAFDLSRFRRLVDLGGATGHLAIIACQRYPSLRAVVFELPGAVPLAQDIITASGVADRIEVAAGDFFSDPLPEGDVFTLGRILHDWTEEKIRTLLRKIYERLPAGGAVLIAEKVLAEDKTGPMWALMQSLNMLVCAEGKERTVSEYERLLRQAGFAEVQGRQTKGPLDAVLAIKKMFGSRGPPHPTSPPGNGGEGTLRGRRSSAMIPPRRSLSCSLENQSFAHPIAGHILERHGAAPDGCTYGSATSDCTWPRSKCLRWPAATVCRRGTGHGPTP